MLKIYFFTLYIIYFSSNNQKSDSSPKKKRDVSNYDPSAEFPNSTNPKSNDSFDQENILESM